MPNENTLALTAAASDLFGQSVNAWTAAQTNKKQRQWQEMMYSRQRTDAMADWNLQNQYNSPQAQMQRLKEAGLNPALIYGSGGATAMSQQSVRSSSPGQWNPKPIEVQPGGVIGAYYNQKIQEATVRNLDTKNTVLLADAAKKTGELDRMRIQNEKDAAQTRSTRQQQLQREMLLPVMMEQIKANISKTGAQELVLHSDKALKDAEKLKTEMDTAKSEAERKIMWQRNAREAAMNSVSIQEAVQRIQNLKQVNSKDDVEIRRIEQETENLKKDKRIKQLEIELREKGLRPGDGIIWRKLWEILDNPSPRKPTTQYGSGG